MTTRHYVRKPGSGRKPKEARLVFEGIVYVLRTGCQWKALPTERFGRRPERLEAVHCSQDCHCYGKLLISHRIMSMRHMADFIHQARFQLIIKQRMVRRLTGWPHPDLKLRQTKAASAVQRLSLHVRPVTRPALLCWVRHPVRTHRVPFDGLQQLGFCRRETKMCSRTLGKTKRARRGMAFFWG